MMRQQRWNFQAHVCRYTCSKCCDKILLFQLERHATSYICIILIVVYIPFNRLSIERWPLFIFKMLPLLYNNSQLFFPNKMMIDLWDFVLVIFRKHTHDIWYQMSFKISKKKKKNHFLNVLMHFFKTNFPLILDFQVVFKLSYFLASSLISNSN